MRKVLLVPAVMIGGGAAVLGRYLFELKSYLGDYSNPEEVIRVTEAFIQSLERP